MSEKLQVISTICATLVAIVLIITNNKSPEPQPQTYYAQSYMLSERARQEVINARGAFVQVDVLKYGDDVKPYTKVVHCRAIDTASGEEVVECYIDEVER
ncbi:hypothetical protein NHG29_04075 [Aerococcaceae bacterium NML160702]|nr:hypothetical protein [Aerococcaceae bacterium NML160702]